MRSNLFSVFCHENWEIQYCLCIPLFSDCPSQPQQRDFSSVSLTLSDVGHCDCPLKDHFHSGDSKNEKRWMADFTPNQFERHCLVLKSSFSKNKGSGIWIVKHLQQPLSLWGDSEVSVWAERNSRTHVPLFLSKKALNTTWYPAAGLNPGLSHLVLEINGRLQTERLEHGKA